MKKLTRKLVTSLKYHELILQKSHRTLIKEEPRPMQSHDNIDLVLGQDKKKYKQDGSIKRSGSSNTSEQF